MKIFVVLSLCIAVASAVSLIKFVYSILPVRSFYEEGCFKQTSQNLELTLAIFICGQLH